MRAGRLVGQRQMPATKGELVNLMFGQQLTAERRKVRDFSSASVVLELEDFAAETARLSLAPLDLSVHEGEIIGLGGARW